MTHTTSEVDITPEGDITPEVLAETLKILATDISRFSKVVCSDIVTDVIPQFHLDIYDMAITNDRLVLAAPRGFSKSCLLAKIYVLWCGLFKRFRDIVIISSSEGLSVEHLRYIKQSVESNPIITELWGDLRSDKWTENHIILKHRDGGLVNIRAKGAGGQIRGYRPDCIVIDDLETDDSVNSEEQRRKLKDWLFKACFNCMLPGGQMLVIGTVLSQLSLLNDLLESPNGWCKRRYTAYKDGIQEPDHELWPDQRPHDWLQQRKREIGSHRFSAEYMNDPITDESAPIKPEHIKCWETLPDQMNVYIAVDPAYSEDAKADYKVAVLIGVDAKGNRYLMNYIRTHQPTGEFINAVYSMYTMHKDRILGVGVPSGGTEREFYRSFVNKGDELKTWPPVVELKNTFVDTDGFMTRKKKARIIAALQPLFENGKYFIGANHHEAREELLTIGNSRWDDVVDAMTYAEQMASPCYYDSSQEQVGEHSAESNMAGACEGYGISY